jgi:hypothetical protein
LYNIQQQQQQQQIKTTTTKLIQTFHKEHSHEISCLLQINPNTLVSASNWSDSFSNVVIVIWSKSKSSSSLYEPIQRITQNEAGGTITNLELINQKKEEEEEEEEQFASCSYDNSIIEGCDDRSIIIWRRGKGGGEFQIKQKITNLNEVKTLLYVSLTNELIFESGSLLQIWSPSSSSSSSSFSSDFVERQKIETSSPISLLCQINKNDSSTIEFASGHRNGQIMIWSKQPQINESEYYSLLKTLQSFNSNVRDLIFINDNGLNFLIACSLLENKIKIFKGGEEEEEEEEELEHKKVSRLIPMSNGQFASDGGDDNNRSLIIWTPSSSSSF